MSYDPFKIRVLMMKRDIEGQELAKATGYHPSTVSRFIRGWLPISDKFAVRAAQVLDVPVEDLRAESGELVIR